MASVGLLTLGMPTAAMNDMDVALCERFELQVGPIPIPDFVPPEWSDKHDAILLAQYALAAAELLEENGWCQESWCDDSGRFCALGAALKVAPTRYAVQLERQAERLIGEYDYVPEWNDAKGRTQEEVINLWLEVASAYENLAASVK